CYRQSMLRTEREWYCRRCAAAVGGEALPFALPGSRAVYAPDRAFDVRHIKIEVALDFERRAVDGVCTQPVAAIHAGSAWLRLDAVEMTLHAVTLADGGALPHTYDGRVL